MSALSEIRLMTLMMKMENVVGKLAEKAGETLDAYTARVIEPLFMSEMKEEEFPRTMQGQLQLFRKEVGEDMWASIAANPALPKLIENFMEDIKIKKIRSIRDKVKPVFVCDEFTEQDLDDFIGLQFGV
jgi:hypothetical protein